MIVFTRQVRVRKTRTTRNACKKEKLKFSIYGQASRQTSVDDSSRL
jgi:hypothetical protein